MQLVLTDRSDLTKRREFDVLAAETWRLGDLGARHGLLLAGLVWGAMPDAMVEADLAAGGSYGSRSKITRPMTTGCSASIGRTILPGPAGRGFLDRVSTHR